MSDVLLSSTKEFILRDLYKLKLEIGQYKTEESIWKLDGEIKNTAGNLCLHLCGNLQHYIGAVLGKSGYIRNRDAEFSHKNISKANLLKEVEATILMVENTLSNITSDTINNDYPELVFGKPMSIGYFLIHLSGHLNYHLGQVNYHRRLLG